MWANFAFCFPLTQVLKKQSFPLWKVDAGTFWGKNWLDPKPNHEYNLYTAKAMHTSKTGNDYNF
jgi:hypothetical protein